MKGNEDVIRDFNEYVNMTADELEKWLKSGDSQSAGWPKGEEGGESVGHDSGRKIVEILRANPKKDAKKYTDDQIQHMRKVASYCARHLAQEEKSNNEKSAEEVKKTKSYASLKNWGHDPLKKRSGKSDSGAAKSTPKGKQASASKDDKKDDGKQNGKDEDDEQEEKEEEEPKNKDADKRAGDKRKAADTQQGKNKKQETEQPTERRATRSSSRNKPTEEKAEAPKETEKKSAAKQTEKKTDAKKDEAGKKEPAKKPDAKKAETKKSEEKKDDKKKAGEKKEEEKKDDKDEDKKSGGGGGKASKGPKPGDKVSWNWGGGQPEGKVLDVKADKATITTKRGNQVSRDGKPDDPAVVLDTGKSKAIKSNHELN